MVCFFSTTQDQYPKFYGGIGVLQLMVEFIVWELVGTGSNHEQNFSDFYLCHNFISLLPLKMSDSLSDTVDLVVMDLILPCLGHVGSPVYSGAKIPIGLYTGSVDSLNVDISVLNQSLTEQ